MPVLTQYLSNAIGHQMEEISKRYKRDLLNNRSEILNDLKKLVVKYFLAKKYAEYAITKNEEEVDYENWEDALEYYAIENLDINKRIKEIIKGEEIERIAIQITQ